MSRSKAKGPLSHMISRLELILRILIMQRRILTMNGKIMNPLQEHDSDQASLLTLTSPMCMSEKQAEVQMQGEAAT